ncbi:LytR/AlgR family response regulator transcription factor, partial [Neisseria sp. P0014.S004]
VLLEECNVVLLNVFHHAMPALEWLSVHEVDIVFADIGMPEIDGLEFVERIKRTAKRQPEIVFTTAYEEHALRAFELAAAD